MEQEPVLIILAAGMGSRYSKQPGLKQVDSIGPCGEKIIDYSIYDAMTAGFKKVVFVIQEQHLPVFREKVFPGMDRHIEIGWAFQKSDDVPNGYSVPKGRTKPWGTGHATLTAARMLDGAPYAVINADDFYGRAGFQEIYNFLKTAKDDTRMNFAMVGFYLKNTVTDNGSVNRGVCRVKDGYLVDVTERKDIAVGESGIAYPNDDGGMTVLSPDAIVSMNLWGFTPSFTGALEKAYEKLHREQVPGDPLNAELYLPFAVNELVEEGKARVTVLSSPDKWYGVTYQEDKPQVAAGIKALTDQGVYPSPLWR